MLIKFYSPSLGLDKHGTCEVDNSITRIDTYFGNQANFHLDRWQALVETAAAHGNLFSQATFVDEKKRTYDDSRATNPVGPIDRCQLLILPSMEHS